MSSPLRGRETVRGQLWAAGCHGRTAESVRWVAFLLGRWRSQLSEAINVIDGAAVGERLALAVCSHSMRMHSARRRLLRDNAAFEKRSRDPVSDDA